MKAYMTMSPVSAALVTRESPRMTGGAANIYVINLKSDTLVLNI